jgi:hypothetical protein
LLRNCQWKIDLLKRVNNLLCLDMTICRRSCRTKEKWVNKFRKIKQLRRTLACIIKKRAPKYCWPNSRSISSVQIKKTIISIHRIVNQHISKHKFYRLDQTTTLQKLKDVITANYKLQCTKHCTWARLHTVNTIESRRLAMRSIVRLACGSTAKMDLYFFCIMTGVPLYGYMIRSDVRTVGPPSCTRVPSRCLLQVL